MTIGDGIFYSTLLVVGTFTAWTLLIWFSKHI